MPCRGTLTDLSGGPVQTRGRSQPDLVVGIPHGGVGGETT